MAKNAKSKRAEAERASEHYAYEYMDCVITRRACRTKWQSVDMFCADVVGKTATGSHVYIQATAGQNEAVRQRRRKLESIPWHKSDRVLLLQLVNSQDPDNKRRKLYHFRVHRYDISNKSWSVDSIECPVPREWFRAFKKPIQ